MNKVAQGQRAERRLTTADKWKIWFNSWRPSSIKKIWQEEVGRIPMKKIQVENGLDRILKGR